MFENALQNRKNSVVKGLKFSKLYTRHILKVNIITTKGSSHIPSRVFFYQLKAFLLVHILILCYRVSLYIALKSRKRLD